VETAVFSELIDHLRLALVKCGKQRQQRVLRERIVKREISFTDVYSGAVQFFPDAMDAQILARI